MNQTCFLGANSREGFASLYSAFPGEPGAFLHIIKGGPGTGKSSFMRCIGQAAEAHSLDAVYVLCSGDPQSLDGVYIPALRRAWVDGTAPHVAEPRSFGVDADYLNLGRFCRTPFPARDCAEIEALTTAYRACYRDAYRHLTRATLREADAPSPEPAELLAGLDSANASPLWPTRRFLRAISCEGVVFLEEELRKLCPELLRITPAALTALSGELERRALPAIRCPLPLDTARLDAILLPWAGVAFLAAWETEGLDEAVAALREAKALHDQLEAIYAPHMDFEALTTFTEQTLRALFREGTGARF